jgi:hypothetical protein
VEDRTLLSTFLVNTTADSGPGSLRQAILDSNSNASPSATPGQTNTIDFAIPGQGVHTIIPLSPLPAITNAVLIDGFSQAGYSNTPLIELSGSQVRRGAGLLITGSDVTVRGLDINDFIRRAGIGIDITGAGATNNWIYGNFVGTDPTGTQAMPNGYGVGIDSGATDNLVGNNGDGINDVSERNLISGNSLYGVYIWGAGTRGNAVAGNWIGTDAAGIADLGNGIADGLYSEGGGVEIDTGASFNTIGGTTAQAGNLITDNGEEGYGDAGVQVGGYPGDTAVGDEITANRIFANNGLAINLGGEGLLLNSSSPQTGPNNLQNYPVIFTTATGQLEGRLSGSCPTRPFVSTSTQARRLARTSRTRPTRAARLRIGSGRSRSPPTARARRSSGFPTPRPQTCLLSPPRRPILRATPPRFRPCGVPAL